VSANSKPQKSIGALKATKDTLGISCFQGSIFC